MRHRLQHPAAWIIAFAPVAACLAPTAASAAGVTATATVPNGTTNSSGAVLFSLNKPGELPIFFDAGYGDGADGNQIVTSMEFEVDNAFGFEGSVSGNTLTVEDALGNLGSSPAEVGMIWEVDPMTNPLPPQPVFPLLGKPLPGPWHSLNLLIAGPDGTSVPVGAAGALIVNLSLGGSPISVTTLFDTTMTTADINSNLDAIFRGLSAPPGFSYLGLNNGFPAWVSDEVFGFSVGILASAGDDLSPGFNTGFVALGAVPEPSSLVLCLIAVGAAIGRRAWRHAASRRPNRMPPSPGRETPTVPTVL